MLTYLNYPGVYPTLLQNVSNGDSYGCSYQRIPLEDIIRMREKEMYQRRKEAYLKKLEKEVYVNLNERSESFDIELWKKFGDFKNYEVRVVQNRRGETILKIEGNTDEFSKSFELDLDLVDINGIDWRYFKEDNILVLRIPKKIPQQTSTIKIKVHKPMHEKRRKHKSHKHESKNTAAQKAGDSATEDIDSHASDISNASSSNETSESASINDSSSSDTETKVLHTPTLEVVEDEEFSSH